LILPLIPTTGIGAGNPVNLSNSLCSALRDEPEERLDLNFNLSAAITQPFAFHRRAEAVLSVFTERHSELNAFVRTAAGGSLAWTYNLAWRMPLTIGYSLAYGQTIADDVTYCSFLNVCVAEDIEAFKEPQFRGVISAAFARERRLPLVDPIRGSRLSAEVRFSGPLVGSDTLSQFLKGVAEYASHHQLGRRSVVGWRVKLGAIVAPERGFEGQELRFVPVDERFYAGGPNTVRGFPFNQLGPIQRVVDAERVDAGPVVVDSATLRTSASGGNDLFLANVEWRYALSRTFTAALFLDAGQVKVRQGDVFDLGQLRITPGVGIRIASPLGPIRLDIGINPYKPESAPLYADLRIYETQPDGTVTQVDNVLLLLQEDFAPESSFWDHFQLNFSIGQAF